MQEQDLLSTDGADLELESVMPEQNLISKDEGDLEPESALLGPDPEWNLFRVSTLGEPQHNHI